MNSSLSVDDRAFAPFNRLSLPEFAEYFWVVVTSGRAAKSAIKCWIAIRVRIHDVIARAVLQLAISWLSRNGGKQIAGVTQGSGAVLLESDSASGSSITYTASGSPVIDKRRVRLDARAPATVAPPAQSPSEEDGRVRARLGAMEVLVIGALVQWASQWRFTNVSNRELGELLKENRACRAVVRGRADDSLDLGQVLTLASGELPGDWRVAAYQWMKQHGSRLQMGQLVSRELGNAISPSRRCAALSANLG